MAWRIEEQVIRGEIDNRTRGKTTGRIWFAGRDRPVTLELAGNPWRDLAGHVLRFSNPAPKPGLPVGLADEQLGSVGDITASRKVKVPDVSPAKLMEYFEKRLPFPWHWGNSLYLEWFSARNGRVVIESASFTLKLDGAAAWTMSEEEETDQRRANAGAMDAFMDRLTVTPEEEQFDDNDVPQSRAETDADREAARMDRLLDRVTARIQREPGADFEKILDEENERLRRERGEPEPEPELTPEETAENRARYDEMNEFGAEALAEAEAESWQGGERSRHPLVTRCTDLAVWVYREIGPGLTKGASAEHPLSEVVFGVQFAAAKLAGALADTDEWPPEATFAGGVLVRLKKAAGHLRDALAGLDAADRENLATPAGRVFAGNEIRAILAETERLIAEVRRVLSEE